VRNRGSAARSHGTTDVRNAQRHRKRQDGGACLSDDAPDPEILAAIADARDALNQTQPALILEITAAIHARGGGRKKFAKVEAAARKAATAVMPTGPDAAETLFTIAELLALARD